MNPKTAASEPIFKKVNKDNIPFFDTVIALNETLLKDGKGDHKVSIMFGRLEKNARSHTGVMCVRQDEEADMPCTHYMTIEDILKIKRETE